MSTLTMYRGDTGTFAVLVTDEDDVPVDISTSDLRFTAKRKDRDDDADAVIVKTSDPGGGIVVSGGTGECVITVDPADTEPLTKKTTLLWDLQVVDGAGDVHTAAYGRLTVKVDISVTAP